MTHQPIENEQTRSSPYEVRMVSPTRETAERLWVCYQQAYRDDNELLERTCNSEAGIDGLTEAMTVDDIYDSMRMPETVAFESSSPELGATSGFVIVPYATNGMESRRRFRDYFMESVFQRRSLRFRSTADENGLLDDLERGFVLYFAEFVSAGGRDATTALMQAVYEEICTRRFNGAPSTILGKCLDSVTIGCCTNRSGNRQVKALAASLGLECVAVADQIRPLQINRSREILTVAFPHTESPALSAKAVLTFGLYRGSAQLAMERIVTRRDATSSRFD